MRKMTATVALLSIVAFLFAASASIRTEAAQTDLSAPDAGAAACQAAGTATAGKLCMLRCNGVDTCQVCCWQHDHWVCK